MVIFRTVGDETLNLNEQILIGIKEAKNLYEKQFETLLEICNLSQLQMDVLLFLANNPEYDTAQSICSLRGLAKSNVSKGVDGLVRQGFLERQTDPDNRRTVHLKLTGKAMPVVREGVICQEKFSRLLIQGIPDAELEKARELFSRIHDNIRRSLGGV